MGTIHKLDTDDTNGIIHIGHLIAGNKVIHIEVDRLLQLRQGLVSSTRIPGIEDKADLLKVPPEVLVPKHIGHEHAIEGLNNLSKVPLFRKTRSLLACCFPPAQKEGGSP
jgi:hypothetical protein